jgi:flavin reductase (DIM6/NTAB) family NADH-FMN oxidoreductase RutF
MTETAPPAGPTIDQRTFWRAIGNRASGSTVVTAQSDDGPAGFLGLSAAHVSADPPLMLVSIDQRTSALQTILAARHFDDWTEHNYSATHLSTAESTVAVCR